MDLYFTSHFFSWFWVFISRIPVLITGQYSHLYPDEIQLFVMALFAISSSFLGVFLVLKRLTMMANAISHTMLLGIVLAFILSPSHAPSEWLVVAAALAVALLTGVFIQELSRVWCVKEDASNGIVFSSLFALGITALSLWSRNTHAGPELLMGNPDALQERDIFLVAVVAISALFTGIIFIRGFTMAIFDPTFATVSGFMPALFSHIMLAQVALTTVSAFRAVGFVMTLSFFVIPPLIARRLTSTLVSMLFCSVGVSLFSIIISVALARHLFSTLYLPVSTGALAAVLLGGVYIGLLGFETVVCKPKLRPTSRLNRSGLHYIQNQ